MFSGRLTSANGKRTPQAVVGLVLRIGGGEPLLNLPAFIPYGFPSPAGSDFPFRTFAMLASLLTIWFVSRVTQLRDPPRPLAESTRADRRSS